MTPCHEAARRYLAMGFHPIPASGKVPAVPWKPYQDEAPHSDQIDEWWTRWPDANVGLVIGHGAIVVDLDGKNAEGLLHLAGIALPKTAPRVRTGGGQHVYLSTPESVGDRIGLFADSREKRQVDIRGLGFVVAPPSRHPSGAIYEWIVPLILPLPEAPAPLLEAIRRPKTAPALAKSEGDWVVAALAGTEQGRRDDTCTRLAGYLLGRGLEAQLVEAIIRESFARQCVPPFPDVDVRKCVQSIARRHSVDGTIDRTITALPLSHVITHITNGDRPEPIASPFPSLNVFLGGGFFPGELVFIGSRPGVGKTALGLEIARRAAKLGTTVLFVSREMVNAAIARRLIAQEARVSASSLRTGRLAGGEEYAVASTLPRLARLPIWLTDEAVSIKEITDLLSLWPNAEPVGLLVVDYLQLVRAPREIKERRLQVEAVSQTLKTLALQFRIPVVCLSSLARPGGDGTERRPTLASLRESGELEHDADVVLLLHRAPMKSETECIVAKNRDGRQGTARLTFRSEFVSFEEPSERAED